MATGTVEKSSDNKSGLASSPYSTLRDHTKAQIEKLIEDLQLSPGDRLPPVRELGRMIGVTRATVGNAEAEMIADGLLVSQPQKGVYLNALPGESNVKSLDVIYCLIEGGGGGRQGEVLEGLPVARLEHNPFWHNVLTGIRNIASARDDIRLRVLFLEDFLAEPSTTPRGRDWSRVGFIVLGDPHTEYMAPLIRLNAPVVLANGITRSPLISNVNIDCALGVEKIVDHLVELGHKKIAYCGTLQRKNRYNYRKFMGFKRAMRKHSLEVSDKHCRDCYFGMEDGYNAAKHLIAMPGSPTAILFMNDESAIGAMRAAVDAGVSVPDDISIAGFDNIVSCSFTNPSLTTVSSRMVEMGEASVKKLIECYDTKENSTVLLSADLVVRESTGRVPQ